MIAVLTPRELAILGSVEIAVDPPNPRMERWADAIEAAWRDDRESDFVRLVQHAVGRVWQLELELEVEKKKTFSALDSPSRGKMAPVEERRSA